VISRDKKRGEVLFLAEQEDKPKQQNERLDPDVFDKGEVAETAAVREIAEETGLHGRITQMLGEKSYWFFQKDENVKFRKTVTYFLVEYEKGEIAGACWEVDEARWVPVNDALRMVSYRSDKEILETARKKLTLAGALPKEEES
jgi:8-oxo-dGTP pyrophosphatase MutT (NUDIX family)